MEYAIGNSISIFLIGLQTNSDDFSKVLCASCRFVQESGNKLQDMFSLVENGSWCFKLAACQFISRYEIVSSIAMVRGG